MLSRGGLFKSPLRRSTNVPCGMTRARANGECGSGPGLLHAALVHYNATSLTAVLAAIESSRAGIDAVRSMFGGFAAADE